MDASSKQNANFKLEELNRFSIKLGEVKKKNTNIDKENEIKLNTQMLQTEINLDAGANNVNLEESKTSQNQRIPESGDLRYLKLLIFHKSYFIFSE